MNLFVTHKCPMQSAIDLPNVLCNKMLLETAQMLSTAHHELDGHIVGYKPTHKNHPCSIWIRKTSENYQWAVDHLSALCEEYTYRTGKIHKTQSILERVKVMPDNIKHGKLTPFAMVMPEKYKVVGLFDQTRSYKLYLNDKFKEWRNRERPMKVEWSKRSIPEWVEL